MVVRARAKLILNPATHRMNSASGARRFCTSCKNPAEVVASLDRHVIGQTQAKKSVAVAVRERWRRSQVEPRELRDEIFPMNILMAGPTVS